MPDLTHNLNRTVLIRATPETVFRFFTDSARWASWWGAGSTIDGAPGGKVYIRHPGGNEVFGEILEADPPNQISFTYGDASRVTITLQPDPEGTRLHLLHEFAEATPRDQHIQGWRFQLSLFGNVVANEVYANAQAAIDDWFAAWVVSDEAARNEILARIATPDVRFKDRYSLLDGAADLTAHIAAAQRFMPGIGLTRKGNVRHCQGTVLANWTAAGPDGVERMSGTSVFQFNPDGRIHSVTGLTN